MKDDEIRSRFDGRGRVELLPGQATAAEQRRIEEIAHAFGYRLLTVHNLGLAGVRLVYERDDAPPARRRNELTIARLRAGGPLLPAVEPPAPPPPGPTPPVTPRVPRQRSGRSPWEPPPPPPPFPPPPPAAPTS